MGVGIVRLSTSLYARRKRPRPSGSSRPAAGSTAPCTPGATSSRRRAASWRTPGRASSRAQNLLLDRYERTSPVRSFPPNGYGLYDVAGNVWEWDDRLLHARSTPARSSTPAAVRAARGSTRGSRRRTRATTSAGRRAVPADGREGRLAPVRPKQLATATDRQPAPRRPSRPRWVTFARGPASSIPARRDPARRAGSHARGPHDRRLEAAATRGDGRRDDSGLGDRGGPGLRNGGTNDGGFGDGRRSRGDGGRYDRCPAQTR